MSLSKSQYYDKPEGEDYVGKMVASNKIAASAAFGFGKKQKLKFASLHKFYFSLQPLSMFSCTLIRKDMCQL